MKEQLGTLLTSLRKKEEGARKKRDTADAAWRKTKELYENAHKLYVGLHGEDQGITPVSATAEQGKEATNAVSSSVRGEVKRRKTKEYASHIYEFLRTKGVSHYKDIHKALQLIMGINVTGAGVYKALDRLANDASSPIVRGEKRGFFVLK